VPDGQFNPIEVNTMSPKNRMKGAVSALLLLCAPCWAISAPSDDQAGERSQAIERYLRQCNRVHVCNGSFLVSQHGKIVYSGVVGQTSSDASRQLSTNSVFDIGSISKQFTAAAVVRLEEEGRLDIDQPVVSYLPGFPYPQVTVRHLLVQTSGVPDVMSHYTSLLKSGPVTNPVELADVVQVLQAEKLPLVSAPGGRWAYSNTGYVLLGKIIEATSGKSYADFLKDEFFIPLGMDRTRVRTPAGEDALGERAMGFAAFADGTTKPYDQIPQLYLYGAGGIYSTAEDLLHWAQALQRGRVMSAKHWEEATRPTTLLDGSQSLYGFGLSLKPSPLGHERITHGGHWRGFKTELTLLPAMDTVIVLLTNMVKTTVLKMLEML
jgi:CubicO group peptidase (beta-lactamase class C family)